MAQTDWITLLLRVGCIGGFISLVAWIAQYSRYTSWWKNPIGRTLVTKTGLIAALLVPTTLSLFFHFNRLTSYVAGWIDAGLVCLIAPVMCWRIAVWHKIHRAAGPGDGGDDAGMAA
jgi:hypothetical protein